MVTFLLYYISVSIVNDAYINNVNEMLIYC